MRSLVAAISQAPQPVRICDPSDASWHFQTSRAVHSRESVDLAWMFDSVYLTAGFSEPVTPPVCRVVDSRDPDPGPRFKEPDPNDMA